MKLGLAHFLAYLTAAVVLARDAPAIASRQVSRQALVARASRTRPFRRQTSQPVCDPNTFKMRISPTEYISAVDSYLMVTTVESDASTFIFRGSNVETTSAIRTPAGLLTAYPGITWSYVEIDGPGATSLVCSMSTGSLVCDPVFGTGPAFFSTCTSQDDYLIFGTVPYDNSCTNRNLVSFPACP